MNHPPNLPIIIAEDLSPLLDLLDQLEADGFRFDLMHGRVSVAPHSRLKPEDRATLSDNRAALATWLAFPRLQRAIIRQWNPALTLQALIQYREAVDAWVSFTKKERALLLPHEPGRADLVGLANLKAATGGEVVEVSGPGGSLTTMKTTNGQ